MSVEYIPNHHPILMYIGVTFTFTQIFRVFCYEMWSVIQIESNITKSQNCMFLFFQNWVLVYSVYIDLCIV